MKKSETDQKSFRKWYTWCLQQENGEVVNWNLKPLKLHVHIVKNLKKKSSTNYFFCNKILNCRHQHSHAHHDDVIWYARLMQFTAERSRECATVLWVFIAQTLCHAASQKQNHNVVDHSSLPLHAVPVGRLISTNIKIDSRSLASLIEFPRHAKTVHREKNCHRSLLFLWLHQVKGMTSWKRIRWWSLIAGHHIHSVSFRFHLSSNPNDYLIIQNRAWSEVKPSGHGTIRINWNVAGRKCEITERANGRI